MASKQIIISQKEATQVIWATGVLTLTDDHETIALKLTADASALLPSAANRLGKRYTFSRLDSTAFTFTLNTTSFEKINDVTTMVLTAQYDSITVEAVDFGTPGFPSPGWAIIASFETYPVREDFSSVLDFNRDKITFSTTSTNIAFTEGTRPKKYGKVITHVLTSTSNATVSFPTAFVVNGRFSANNINYLSFVSMPNVTGDLIFVTIRQKTPPVAAEGISVVGIKKNGEVASAVYSFAGNGQESGTTFQWYRANDAVGNGSAPISGATSQNYTLQAGDVGKYVLVGIVARTTTLTGTESFSPWWGPIVA